MKNFLVIFLSCFAFSFSSPLNSTPNLEVVVVVADCERFGYHMAEAADALSPFGISAETHATIAQTFQEGCCTLLGGTGC